MHISKKNKNFFKLIKSVYTPIFFTILIFFLISCERQYSYLPSGNSKHLHYEITFIDKEKITKKYKQSYFLKESDKRKSVLVRSDRKSYRI